MEDITDFFQNLDKAHLRQEILDIRDMAQQDLREKGYSGDILQQEIDIACALTAIETVLSQYHEWLVAQIDPSALHR